MRRDPDDLPADADTRAVIDQLRALPREGGEPDWGALERSINDAVAAEGPPRRAWWRWFGARWLVPAAALATAAAVLALVVHDPAPEPAFVPAPIAVPLAPVAAERETVALWLDGEDIEVGLVEADDLLELPWEITLDDADDVIPVADLAWIDDLDGEALDRAEAWLRRKPS